MRFLEFGQGFLDPVSRLRAKIVESFLARTSSQKATARKLLACIKLMVIHFITCKLCKSTRPKALGHDPDCQWNETATSRGQRQKREAQASSFDDQMGIYASSVWLRLLGNTRERKGPACSGTNTAQPILDESPSFLCTATQPCSHAREPVSCPIQSQDLAHRSQRQHEFQHVHESQHRRLGDIYKRVPSASSFRSQAAPYPQCNKTHICD